MPTRKLKQNSDLHPFDHPLTGKLRTDVDPVYIGETNFRQLTNFRYKADGIKGIQGMTKINVSALAYTDIVNGFFFKKEQPTESHVFIQATSGSNSRLYKSDNTTAIPAQDTFTNIQTLENNNLVRFSDAPKNTMVALNGVTNRIWGGNEDQVGRFVVYDPNDTFWYDFTDQVRNILTDTANIATLHGAGSGGNDSNTKLLLHLDNNPTNSAAGGSGVATAVGLTYSNADYVFGGYSGIFDGSTTYLHIPDSADFDFTGGSWAVDMRVKIAAPNYGGPVYYQSDGSGNYMMININVTLQRVELIIHHSTDLVSLHTDTNSIPIAQWYYISVQESGNNYYIFAGSTAATATLLATTSSASRADNYTNNVQIGYDGTNFYSGKIDEIRVSKTNRNTASYAVPLAAYSTATSISSVLIGTTRPVQGFNLYVGTANTQAATPAVFTWTGSTGYPYYWTALTVTSDTTVDVGGTKTLGKTGKGEIKFASTVSTSKVKSIRHEVAYYYILVFSGIDQTTTIYYSTIDAPIQAITDIWDGSERTCLQCWEYTTEYNDITPFVAPSTSTNPRAYVATLDTTYAQIGGLTSSQYLYCAFAERQMGLIINMPDTNYVNTTANTVAYVDWWNGISWAQITPDDSTSTGVISLSHSGTLYFNPADENTEFQTKVANDYQFYYYRVHFSQTLSVDVRIDFIGGISAQKTLRPYKFAVNWQERLLLFNDQSEKKSTGIYSAFGTNCVFNGTDSSDVEFGTKELICGGTLYSRYSNSIYDSLILCSRDSTYLFDGTSPSNWTLYKVSDTVGCVAALTFQRCDLSFDVAQGITKHVLIWRSAAGIEVYDGNTIARVSEDIESFFDPSTSDYINPATYDVSAESAFYDPVRFEYHWLFTNASGKLEWVYNVKRKKWSEFSRGTGKALNCAVNVQDTQGAVYTYGGTSDGFIERLEYGTTMDGNGIAYTFWTGDILLVKSANYVVKLRHLKIVAKAKNISTATVIPTVYLDTATTGVTLPAISQANGTHRVYQWKHSAKPLNAVFFGFKFTITTTNEVIGYEPLLLSGLYSVEREDIL